LEKDNPWEWGCLEEEVFQNIKNRWSENLELLIPDLNIEFTLETDASQYGLGACLMQNEQPVAFISRTLSKNEIVYGITEKEVLGALWAMEKFRYFLEGRKFTLVTDHKAIEFIRKKLDFGSARIIRWFERFERFEFDVKFKPGEELIAADALSRSQKNTINKIEKCDENIKKNVLQLHIRLNHRKNIKKECEDEKIKISENDLRRILNCCEVCLKYDKIYSNGSEYIETNEPGEIVAFDLLEIKKNQRIILGIDYFSRKLFEKF
jgi:hypothetical protein